MMILMHFAKFIVKIQTNLISTNAFVRPSFLERVDLFGIYPSLIHYAAFFNSIKIFKYLVLHHAELNDELNENWLLKCAIAGGSVEVVRFLEQKKINIIEGIHYEIEYCQNDILVWILENQMHSSDYYSEITPDEDRHFTNHFLDFDSNFFIDLSFDKPFYCDNEDFYFDEGVYHNMLILNLKDNPIDENFKYINFDGVFKAIAESNNLQALFIFLDHGMDINAFYLVNL